MNDEAAKVQQEILQKQDMFVKNLEKFVWLATEIEDGHRLLNDMPSVAKWRGIKNILESQRKEAASKSKGSLYAVMVKDQYDRWFRAASGLTPEEAQRNFLRLQPRFRVRGIVVKETKIESLT